MFGFFARRVEHWPDGLGKVGRCLQQQRRLADAGLAAEEDQRSRHDAAAEDAIELANARRDAIGLRGLNIRVFLGAWRLETGHRVAMRGRPAERALERPLLDKRAPGAAIVALALPLGPLHAAFLADEDGFSLLH